MKKDMHITKRNGTLVRKWKSVFLGMALLTSGAMSMTSFIMAQAASDEVVYDAANFSSFSNRTMEEVGAQYSQAYYAGTTYINNDSSSYYSEQASIKSPYNKGKISDDTQKTMSSMTNFYRWLTGANPVIKESSNTSPYAQAMQAQALDRNFYWGHFIPDNSSKPEDMDDATWEEGFECTHNILAMGSTPAGAITSWLNEGYSLSKGAWDTFGHRNAIIDPAVSNIQYGYCGNIAIGKNVESRNTKKEVFTAFPAPGYMPNSMVRCNSCGWNVYLDSTKVKVQTASSVEVTVTNLNSNESYICTKSNGKLSASTAWFGFVQPSDYSGSSYTDSYRVEVTGLYDVATGKNAKLVYEVKFFDIKPYITSPVLRASGPFTTVAIPQSLLNESGLQKVASMLPKTVTVKSDSGATATIDAAGEWVVDMDAKCFVNQADASDLPETITDQWKRLERITMPYSENTTTSAKTTLKTQAVKPGGSNILTAYHMYSSSGYATEVYQIKESAAGKYTAKKRFDSVRSDALDVEASSNYSHCYNMSNVTTEDAGEYLSIYYLPGYNGTGYINAAVTLEVRDYGIVTETYGPCNKLYIYSGMNTQEGLLKLANTLASTITVASDVGDLEEVATVGAWQIDSENNCFVNWVDETSLPENIVDSNEILKEPVKISYAEGSNTNYYIRVNKAKMLAGSPLKFTLHRYNLGMSVSQVYQLNTDENGKQQSRLRFDSRTSPEFEAGTSGTDTYTVSNSSDVDSGEYMAIFFSPSSNPKTRTAYAAYTSATVNVSDTENVTSCYGPYRYIYLYNRYTPSDYLEKIAATLPKKVSVVSEYSTTYEFETAGRWSVDTENRCFVNQVSKQTTPSTLIDENDMLQRIEVPYILQSYSNYKSYAIAWEQEKVHFDGNATLTLQRASVSYNISKVYRVGQKEDETYEATCVLDRETSPEYDAEQSDDTKTVYRMKQLQAEDAGEYIAVQYVGSASNASRSAIYTYNSAKLTVDHTWDAGVVLKEATAREDGKRQYTCEVCQKTKTEPIPSTGEATTTQDASTTQEAGNNTESTQQSTTRPEGSTEQSTQRPESSTQQSTARPESNTQQSTARPESSTQQSTQRPEGSTEQSTQRPESSTQQSTQRPESNTQQSTTRPESSTQQSTTRPESSTQQSTQRPESSTQQSTQQETVVQVEDPVAFDTESGTYILPDSTKQEVKYAGSVDKNCKVVEIPNVITIQGTLYKVSAISDGAFQNQKALKKVVIGSQVTTIGKNAFRGCTKLETIKGGKNVKKIGANAFSGCKTLKSIFVFKKTTHLGANTFYGCSKLKSITFKSTQITKKTIAKNAFRGMSKKTVVKVPKKKLTIYKTLFRKKGLSSKNKVKK